MSTKIFKNIRKEISINTNSTQGYRSGEEAGGDQLPPKIKNIFGFLRNFLILSAEFLKISRKILAETHFFSFYSQFFWQKVEKTLSVNRILQKVGVLDIFGSVSARKSDEVLPAKMFGLSAEFLAPPLTFQNNREP